MSDLQYQINALAPCLNELERDDDAEVNYRIFIDAFVWSDEMPAESLGDEELVFNYLLRYRTSLLIGQPIVELEPYWEAARLAWQGWPGLSPERCRYSDDFKQKYDKFQANEDGYFESFND